MNTGLAKSHLTITRIEWERVWVTIEFAFDQPVRGEIDFAIYDERRAYPLDAVASDNGHYVARINVTNFRDRRHVPDGSWRFMSVIDGHRGPVASFPLERARELDNAGRSFIYNRDQSIYAVTFALSDEERADVVFNTYQLNRTMAGRSKSELTMKSSAARPGSMRRMLYTLDKVTAGLAGKALGAIDRASGGKASSIARGWLHELRSMGLRGRIALRARDLSLLNRPQSKDLAAAEREAPTFAKGKAKAQQRDKLRILFASDIRPTIAGNLLSIRDRMVERGLDDRFEMAFSFRTLDDVTPSGTLHVASEVNSADIILIDDYFPVLNKINLRSDQRLIQVWHAGSGFKSVGYSRFGYAGSPRLVDIHRKYTFAICGSSHLVPVYAEVFGIPENAVVATGLPRIDSFLDPVRARRVAADFETAYPEFAGKKKILFAPTFRGEGAKTAHYDFSQLDFAKLYELCGDEYVFLIRMHHFVVGPVPIPPQFQDRIFDFSRFPDGNDLLHSTDLLITDYSSIIYEFSLLARPMLFFAYDRDHYSATRGFHRPYEESAPGKVCLTFDSLIEAINSKDFEEWRIEEFRRNNFDYIDIGSADRVIDQLILNDPRQSAEAKIALEVDAMRMERAWRLAEEQLVSDANG